jgi:hypothetical protein
MAGTGALQHALDLAATPGLARPMRRQPPPRDVLTVIKIAAGCQETLAAATAATGKRPEALTEASVLYLQQILFAREAGAYRILGVSSDAPQELIGQHMRWLMKWLHPDRAPNEWESAFAERVAGAWDQVKTPAKRANYDRQQGPEPAPRRSSSRRQRPTYRRPWIPRRTERSKKISPRQLVLPALAALVLAALLFLPDGLLGALRGAQDVPEFRARSAATEGPVATASHGAPEVAGESDADAR